MARLVMVRHGESSGNAQELFTGIMDVGLTDLGRREASGAARLLAEAGLWPGTWFVSPMRRSRQTADVMLAVALDEFRFHGDRRIPDEPDLRYDGRLLERNYGALTGRSKAEVRQEHGDEQFRSWRRSMDGTPPPMDPGQLAELARAFEGVEHVDLTPTECLRDVMVRVGQWWQSDCLPLLRAGQDVLVVAHGNSLRALCAVLYQLDDDEVAELNIPNAQPLVHELGESGFAGRTGSYLDEVTAVAAAARIAAAGGT